MSDDNLTLQEADRLVLAIDEDTPVDQLAAVVDKIEFAKRAVRIIDAQLKDRLIEWIDANGELTIGDIRYYVGPKKTVRCRNNRETIEQLLTVTDGDFDRVAECLSANAIKPGAAREILGDEFDVYFETYIDKEVRTGKPKREVKQINQRFVR